MFGLFTARGKIVVEDDYCDRNKVCAPTQYMRFVCRLHGIPPFFQLTVFLFFFQNLKNLDPLFGNLETVAVLEPHFSFFLGWVGGGILCGK